MLLFLYLCCCVRVCVCVWVCVCLWVCARRETSSVAAGAEV
jgi:hypothetical protein